MHKRFAAFQTDITRIF